MKFSQSEIEKIAKFPKTKLSKTKKAIFHLIPGPSINVELKVSGGSIYYEF